MTGHRWSPIEDLPSDWNTVLVDSSLQAAMQTWKNSVGLLRDRRAFQDFTERLHRKWAIETGVIEGAYVLSDGATLTLIQHGLDSALVSHDDTGNEDPQDVVRIIKDQHQAIMGLYQFVASQRPLSTGYIRELHQVLMAHQPTYRARDQFGNEVIRELKRGDWKSWPNHVELDDGNRFEYCPPEHVAQEMDNLIAQHHRHIEIGVSPDIEAAWLHHRFTLIHPFEDGNGRVARCLATLVLLRAEWLPLVITRQDKADYISAIRHADAGELKPLVDFFGANQRRSLHEARDTADEALDLADSVQSEVASISQAIASRKHGESELQRQAFELTDMLCEAAKLRLGSMAKELTDVFKAQDIEWKAFLDSGERSSKKATYNGFQIKMAAKELGYFANLPDYQAWVKLAIEGDSRFEFLIAFHGIGRSRIGYLGAAAMVYRKVPDEELKSRTEDLRALGKGPFEFTYSEDKPKVSQSFDLWLDDRIKEALAIWRGSL